MAGLHGGRPVNEVCMADHFKNREVTQFVRVGATRLPINRLIRELSSEKLPFGVAAHFLARELSKAGIIGKSQLSAAAQINAMLRTKRSEQEIKGSGYYDQFK